jgi:hypothetical protein
MPGQTIVARVLGRTTVIVFWNETTVFAGPVPEMQKDTPAGQGRRCGPCRTAAGLRQLCVDNSEGCCLLGKGRYFAVGRRKLPLICWAGKILWLDLEYPIDLLRPPQRAAISCNNSRRKIAGARDGRGTAQFKPRRDFDAGKLWPPTSRAGTTAGADVRYAIGEPHLLDGAALIPPIMLVPRPW